MKKPDYPDRLRIDCGCGPHLMMSLDLLWEDDENNDATWILEFWIPEFYAKQNSILRILWERLKVAIKIVLHGDYFLHDIILYRDDLQALKEYFDRQWTRISNG
jgi:hypothetical protein